MGILTPGAEFYDLIYTVVADLNLVFQNKGGELRSGLSENRDKNIEAVAALNEEIRRAWSRTSIDIYNKRRAGTTLEVYGGYGDPFIEIIDQLNLLGNRACGGKNGIKEKGIRGGEKEGISVQIRLFLAGNHHESGKN